jgi:hypothetical protein
MFDSKVSARSAIRTVIGSLGTAVALNALEDAINNQYALEAYGRGRRSLKMQTAIACRAAVRHARKEATDRAERKAAVDAKVAATHQRMLNAVVKEFSAPEVCAMVTQLFKDVDLSEELEACNTAQERFETRRALFACPTEQRLGIESLKPEAKE